MCCDGSRKEINMQNQVQHTSKIPYRQIQALYNNSSIRVYQAYSAPIADSALGDASENHQC